MSVRILQGDGLIVTGHDDHGAKFQPFGQMHVKFVQPDQRWRSVTVLTYIAEELSQSDQAARDSL
jgi:hypothetical protein